MVDNVLAGGLVVGDDEELDDVLARVGRGDPAHQRADRRRRARRLGDGRGRRRVDAGAQAMIDRERLLALQRRGLRDWIAALGSASPGAQLFERDGVAAAIVPASPDRSIANSVSFSDPAALAGLLDELAGAYERAGVEAWTVWVPEFDAETIAILEAAGHAFDGKPLAMALELEGWSAARDRRPRLGPRRRSRPARRAQRPRLRVRARGRDGALAGPIRRPSSPSTRRGSMAGRRACWRRSTTATTSASTSSPPIRNCAGAASPCG